MVGLLAVPPRRSRDAHPSCSRFQLYSAMLRRLKIVSAAALLGVTALTASESQTPAQAPAFRSGIDLVHLDVSVLDRNRRPVRGLTPADFTILENGKPQELAAFKAVEVAAEPPTVPWIRDVAPDVVTNEGVEDRRLFLLILDDAMIQSDLRAVDNVRVAAGKVIDELSPGDMAAVIFTRDNRNSQDYTADRSRLRAAVERFSLGFRDMGQNDLYLAYSIGVVESAVATLGTLAGRRKAIIYIGQGLPLDLALMAPQSPGGLTLGGASPISGQGLMASLKGRMERAIRGAAQANANIYTIDACGLRAHQPPPPPPPARSAPPTCVPGLEVDYLKTLADNTGARAITDTNDFAAGVSAIFNENAAYYLLGYQSADRNEDGTFRRLEVRVNRPDVEVRTRSGYEAPKKDNARQKAAVAASPLRAAMAGLLPTSDLSLRLAAMSLAIPGRRESAVAIVLGVRQPARPDSVRVDRVERVDLQVSAFNLDGKALGEIALHADVAFRPDVTGVAEYEVLARLDLKPGRYQLRASAHIARQATSGSIYSDLDVPDFSSGALSLSGLALSASPGPAVGSADTLQTIVPIVPTARRTFTTGHQVSAFARFHQGGKAPPQPIAVRLQLRNDSNELVMDRREELAVTRFAPTRFADLAVELPLARLRPGDYLLTLEGGTATTTIRRDARFEIVRDGR